DQTDIARHYQQARTLTPGAMAATLQALLGAIAPRRVRGILDIGCGTGRFTAALHEHFDTWVVGLDPSHSMLAQAQQAIHHPAIRFVRATGESLPLPATCADLAYLSMVYHHLQDAPRVAQELSRVLRPGGYVCVRNSVVEHLDTFVHLRYFPEARALLEQRLPHGQEIVAHMRQGGFHLLSEAAVHLEDAPSFTHLYEKVRLRAQSELAGI